MPCICSCKTGRAFHQARLQLLHESGVEKICSTNKITISELNSLQDNQFPVRNAQNLLEC